MENHKVDVILATYNGDRYLKEQLDSLINQTFNDINIIISDDGSTDNTVSIIENYSKKYSNIRLVNKEKQGGVVNNFNKALSYSKSKYIMFCDQDDVWLNDKIKTTLEYLKELEEKNIGKGILVFSDLKVVDDKLKILSESYYKSNGLNPLNNSNVSYLSWRSTVYGCTCMFNKELLNIRPSVPNQFPMHDHFYALVAASHGIIGYLDKALILYRQHNNNVVGGGKKSFIEKLLSMKKLLINMNTVVNKTVNINKEIEQNYRLVTLNERIKFIYKNIAPYYNERLITYTIFSIMILLG